MEGKEAHGSTPTVFRLPIPISMRSIDIFPLSRRWGHLCRTSRDLGFKLLEEDMAAVRDIGARRGFSVDRPWIAMNIGARWPTKRWPLESFAAVVDQLYEARRDPLVMIGGSEERAYTEQLRVLTKSPFIDLVR